MSNRAFKLFGRFNALDFACLLLIGFCGLGFVLAREGHAGVNQQIKGTKKVDIDVYFVGVKTKDLNLFKVGDTTALTIRNVPVNPPMVITAVKRTPKMASFLSPDGKKAVAFPDPSAPIASDFEVTVNATADITNDGYVVSGNKLKVGNSVELESFKYRVQGVVADINLSKQQ